MEVVKNGEKILAIIVRASFQPSDNIQFFTPNEFSQQLAYMRHPKGKTISAHVHNPVQRNVFLTQEVLVIRSGILRVDLYSDEQQYLTSHLLYAGDVILLASGGHGFEVVEEVEMIEVKQGPYAGDLDKTRFDGVISSKVMIK